MKFKILSGIVMVVLAGSLYAYREVLGDRVRDYLLGSDKEPIPTVTLAPSNYIVRVRARGQLTGLRTTPVRPPAVRGSLKVAWLAEEGKLVRAGDVLVRFDNTDALQALQENRNTVLSYDSRIKKNDLDRDTEMRALLRDGEAADLELYFAQNQVLRDEDIFTRWEIQESIMSAALAEYKKQSVSEKTEVRTVLSQADRRILQIEQGKAQTEMDQARSRLSSLELAAPADGVLIFIRHGFQELEVGGEVWPGQEIVEIADMESFRSELWVAEADISGVVAGKPVDVTLDAFPARVFEGRVESVSKIAEQRSRKDPRRYFTCTVSLRTPPEILGQLKPGMRLDGDIQVENRRQAFVLPKSAIFKEESRFLVFVDELGEFREREIQIVDSDHGFYVIEGVKGGDVVSLRHPFRSQDLHLPDFNAPATATQNRRFIMVVM